MVYVNATNFNIMKYLKEKKKKNYLNENLLPTKR